LFTELVDYGFQILIEFMPDDEARTLFDLKAPVNRKIVPIRPATSQSTDTNGYLHAAVMMMAHIKGLNLFWRNKFKEHELSVNYIKKAVEVR
jgi:hypothetical protein